MDPQPVNHTDAAKDLPLATALFTSFLCMLFGANAVAMKFSLTGIGVFTTAGLRFGIAALVLFCWARITHRSLRVTSRQLTQLAFLTLIFFFQISCFYTGLSKTSASHGVLIGNLLPFVVMVLAHYLLPDDRIDARKICGLIFGFTGVSLLFFDKAASAYTSLAGDLFIVCAVIAWGCNAVYAKKIIGQFRPIQITIYPMIMGVPLYFLCGFFFDPEMVFSTAPPVILGMLYQSIVTASFGFVAWNNLLKTYGATAIHSFVFIMPISGVSFGVMLLGEPLTPALLGAIALVTAGLLIINYHPPRKTNRS